MALVAFWTLVGRAVLALLRPKVDLLREMLLSPVVGVVVTVIPLFLINRAGLAVGRFGHWLVVVYIIAAGAVIWFKRPARPTAREVMPFILIVLLGMLLSGWPLFQFGFDWL